MAKSWYSLPPEIRTMILKDIIRQGSCSCCVAVCSEWKAVIEPHNLYRLELRVPCLNQLSHMKVQTARFVRQLRLNIELPRYSCQSCRTLVSQWRITQHSGIFRAAILRLLTILSAWSATKHLTLEINTFSPSDSEHWFKNHGIGQNCQNGRNSEQQQQATHPRWHDPQHGWFDGRQVLSPPAKAMAHPLGQLCYDLPKNLPEVHAVTRLVIRRECLRQIPPPAMGQLLRRLPRLEAWIYEPWREWAALQELGWEVDFASVIQRDLPSHVEKLSFFQDPIRELAEAMRRDPSMLPNRIVNDNSVAAQQLVRALIVRCQTLTHLSISFMVNARLFLFHFRPSDVCPKLQSLALTWSHLQRKAPAIVIDSFLIYASKFAKRAKGLKRLILWNSTGGEACAFIYERDTSIKQATLTIRASWPFALNKEVEDHWKGVAPDSALQIENEQLPHDAAIRNNGDAIYHLRMPVEVIDPKSARQLRQEGFMGMGVYV